MCCLTVPGWEGCSQAFCPYVQRAVSWPHLSPLCHWRLQSLGCGRCCRLLLCQEILPRLLMDSQHLLSENVGRSHLIDLNKVVAACRKRHTLQNYEVCQPTFDSWLLHKSSLKGTREEGSPCTGCGILSLLTLSLHVLAGKLKELHLWWLSLSALFGVWYSIHQESC